MKVRTVRPHRNDHENDQGKPGWKHTGTEYEHPDPETDIRRGLIEPIGEVEQDEKPEPKAPAEEPAAEKSAMPEKADKPKAKTPVKTQAKGQSKAGAKANK